MKKIPIEREKSDVRISSSEREEARPKVKILFLHGFFASGQCQPALALREAFCMTDFLSTRIGRHEYKSSLYRFFSSFANKA